MADTKISALTELTTLADDDELVIVDKSDTTMAASGTNKRIKHKNVAGGEVVISPTGGDDTSLISAAMDEANADGKVLVFTPGNYDCGQIDKSFAPKIVGLPGATILPSTTSSWVWRFTGSLGSAANLTGNAAIGQSVIAVSTTGLVAGDLVIVGETTAVHSADSATKYVGQQAEIASIDSGSQLTLKEPLYRAFTTAATAFVKKVTPIEDVSIKGLRFDMGSASGHTTGFIRISYGRRVELDFDGRYAGAAGVRLNSCYDFRARTRAERYAWDSGAGQFGYGVECMNACSHGQVNVQALHGANAFTTSTEATLHGEPQNIVVSGINIGSATIGFGTHPAGYGIVFDGIHVQDTAGPGMEIRNRGITIRNSWFERLGTYGIWGYDAIADLSFANNHVRYTGMGGTSSADGLRITPAAVGIRVRNNHFEEIGLNVLRFSSTLTDGWILNNSCHNYGTQSVAGETRGFRFAGLVTRCRVHGNTMTDDPTATSTDMVSLPALTNVDVTSANNCCHNGIQTVGANVTGLTEHNNLETA